LKAEDWPMSRIRLTAVSAAAVVFALFETGVAYAQPDMANSLWAGFAWLCVLFVAAWWWNVLRTK
jgi:hypothetical protein